MSDSQTIDSGATAVEQEPPSAAGTEAKFDIDSAVSKIGDRLNINSPSKDRSDDIEPEDEGETVNATVDEKKPEPKSEPEKPAAKETESAPSTAPKSWPKEMHQHWDKMPKEAQEYWGKREKQMLDGLSQYKEVANFGSTLADTLRPYEQVIRQQGIDAPTAVKHLLEAHTMLTTGPIDGRIAAYRKLGDSLGLSAYMVPQAEGGAQQAGGVTPARIAGNDPYIDNLSKQVQNMQQYLNEQSQVSLQETAQRVMKDIEAFASDPSHPYFDDVADDIAVYIKSGLSLPDAYEKAIWANPSTRLKQVEAINEAALKKDRENARLQSLPKKDAASVNVRGSESQRRSHDPVGSLDDTLRQTLREIKGRTA